jgi:hypothetical protein
MMDSGSRGKYRCPPTSTVRSLSATTLPRHRALGVRAPYARRLISDNRRQCANGCCRSASSCATGWLMIRDRLPAFSRYSSAPSSSRRRRSRSEWGLSRYQCGGVTFIQRFGDTLNLNMHFHSLLLDGVLGLRRARHHEMAPPSCARCRGNRTGDSSHCPRSSPPAHSPRPKPGRRSDRCRSITQRRAAARRHLRCFAAARPRPCESEYAS